MRNRTKAGLAVIAVLAIAAPAGVVAGGGNANADFIAYESIGAKSTNSRSFQPLGLFVVPVGTTETLTLSAEMKQGKARFRVGKVGDASLAEPPQGVVFAAPGANAFAFHDEAGCDSVEVEWKRVGKKRAKLARASLYGIGEGGC